MSQGSWLNSAKKVSIIVEDESGFEYRLNFGDEPGRKLHVESALNQQFRTDTIGTYYPAFQHPTRREFNLRISF